MLAIIAIGTLFLLEQYLAFDKNSVLAIMKEVGTSP